MSNTPDLERYRHQIALVQHLQPWLTDEEALKLYLDPNLRHHIDLAYMALTDFRTNLRRHAR